MTFRLALCIDQTTLRYVSERENVYVMLKESFCFYFCFVGILIIIETCLRISNEMQFNLTDSNDLIHVFIREICIMFVDRYEGRRFLNGFSEKCEFGYSKICDSIGFLKKMLNFDLYPLVSG